MANIELDSFYIKFKSLLNQEKDAVLTLKSESGRAQVTLSVELGHVLSDHLHHYPINSTSRARRRQKRTNARKLAAEEASKSVAKADDNKEKKKKSS